MNTDGTLSTVRTISFDCTLGATGVAADAHDTVYISSSPDAPNYGIDIVPAGVTDCRGNPKAIAGEIVRNWAVQGLWTSGVTALYTS